MSLYKGLPATNQPKLKFFRDVSVGLVGFLRTSGQDLTVSSAVVQMLELYPETRPEKVSDNTTLCRTLVTILAGLRPPTQPEKIPQFRANVVKMAALLPVIWDSSGRRDQMISETLHSVYTIIVDTGGSLSQAPCLGFVLDKISVDTLSGTATNLSGEQTVKTISSMIDWLGLFPFKQLDQHILAICARVAATQPEIVKRLAREKIATIVKKLFIPLLRGQLEPVFVYLVLSNQSCEAMMTRLCSSEQQSMADLLYSLQMETLPASKESWLSLAECGRHLLTLHSSLKEEKTLQLVRATESLPELSETRKEQLRGKELGSEGSQAGSENLLTFQTKQVGLINLGNTCYMNCIIQALFNTAMFRSLMFAQDFQPIRQPVLSSLQNVFIFLRYSSRNIFSPSELLRLARPSWFESGRQQDCSELLTHLLDTVQEEEKSAFPRIEDTSQDISGEGQTPGKLEDNDEIMKSCENVSSLDNDNNTHTHTSDDETKDTIEDQVMTKVAKKDQMGSSSSLGLSRWSTEENLSVGDSREGLNTLSPGDISRCETETPPVKEEPCESQSTGSDSGIHSVESLPSNQTPLTLVQKVFGGRMMTSFHCDRCQSKSEFSDWFTDIHLPIPQISPPDIQKQQLSQALQTINTSSEPSSQVDGGGGGTSSSSNVEVSSAPAPRTSSKPPLSSLLKSYFEPERLSGDNKYFCERCDGYEEAERRVSVVTPPECLIITLLRFKYDTATQRRVKIMTGLEYPQYLNLPVGEAGSPGEHEECYKLYGVVVHSGYTSDGGHYYTWVRSSENHWRILNDSSVDENQDWSQFVGRTSQNSSQTPYLLLFTRLEQEKFEDYHPSDEKLSKVKLDNMKLIQDKNRASQWGQGGGIKRNKDEDDDSGGGGGSGNCHDNFGQIGGGHFVC